MMVSNRILLFQGVIFRCYVSFREGNSWRRWCRTWPFSSHKLTMTTTNLKELHTWWNMKKPMKISISKARSTYTNTGNTYFVQSNMRSCVIERPLNWKHTGTERYLRPGVLHCKKKRKGQTGVIYVIASVSFGFILSWQWDIQRLWRLQCVHAMTNS